MKIQVTDFQSKWVGQSESQLKAIFDDYRMSFDRMKIKPILFLNECDQIIGRRISIGSSVDQMSNALQNILLEEMAKDQIKAQGIKLLIAGEFYEDKTPYLDLIKNLGLEENVILHDRFIANEDVRYYFCSSNLVAQTYRNATNSGVTMVGYFYEKPMLVTNVGGLAEIVPNQKCGYVTELSVNEIANNILDYFVNQREDAFTKNVQIENNKYEWTTFINSLLTLYNSC